jgi:hypothetical protein
VDISDAVAEAILSTRSDAIVSADRDGIIRFWNPGASRLFGYSHNGGNVSLARPHYSAASSGRAGGNGFFLDAGATNLELTKVRST